MTGCGNAFCGGFLAAWQRTRDLKTAAAWGCAAASFMAECQAVPSLPPHDRGVQEEARERAEHIAKLARTRAAHVPAAGATANSS